MVAGKKIIGTILQPFKTNQKRPEIIKDSSRKALHPKNHVFEIHYRFFIFHFDSRKNKNFRKFESFQVGFLGNNKPEIG